MPYIKIFDTSECNISVDPWMGENPAINGYHLPNRSGCIDKGTNKAPYLPDTDMDGAVRISGRSSWNATVDIGADEYGFSERPISLSWMLLLLGE